MEEQKQHEDIPEAVIEELRAHAKEEALKATHDWKQKGGWVKCTSCMFPHAFRIESHKRLTGIKDGVLPMIK